MSKGSSYWSTARGKIGNTVVSIVRGQRIERAYQPSVNNPRTSNQMVQRAKFFSAVEFYKEANKAFFKMAYEDKRQTESDYNAFMRHNVSRAPMLSRASFWAAEGVYEPVSPWNWQLTQGSLEGPVVTPNGGESWEYNVNFQGVTVSETTTTIGALSELLIASGLYQQGDIITIVEYITNRSIISADDGPRKDPVLLGANSSLPSTPRFLIKQFAISTADTRPIADFGLHVNDDKLQFIGVSVDAQGDASIEVIRFAAVIVSRPGKSLKVSTSYLVADSYTKPYMEIYATDDWQQGVLRQWQTSENVILEGSLV